MKLVIETDMCKYSAEVPTKIGKVWEAQLDVMYKDAVSYIWARDIKESKNSHEQTRN